MGVVALALGACATRIAQRGDTTPTRNTATSGHDAGGDVPVGSDWLRDAQGRAYRERPLPKRQGTLLGDGTMRTTEGVRAEVAREDADHYYIKFYAPPPGAAAAMTTPTPAVRDHERVAASYRPEVRASHRLRFVPFGNGLPVSGQWRDGFDVADMNGDGLADIVHGSPRKGSRAPAVFLGDGRGNWYRWPEASFPPLAYDYGDTRAGDLNGDGAVDLVLGMHLRGLVVLLGDGRGAFASASRGLDFTAPGSQGISAFSSRALQLVDWNRDGRLDVLALGEGPRLTAHPRADGAATGVAIYLNDGEGGWTRYAAPPRTAAIFGLSLTVADFDADGRADFATGSSILGRTDLVHLGRPGGTWQTVSVPELRPGYVRAVTAADFDRDGRADLAVGYQSFELGTWRTGIDVLFSRPDGAWNRRVLASETGSSGVFALAHGDLDGDDALDVVALSGNGQTTVFPGDGHGGFTREESAIPPFAGGCRGVHVELADLDGERGDEIAAAFAEEPANVAGAERCSSQGGIAAWKVDRGG